MATNTFRYFLYFNNRVEEKEIVAGALKNFGKVIRLFCKMNDIKNLVPWIKLKITMPKVKRFADNRSPTIEKILKFIEYTHPCIKPLVYLMSSSGIRLGVLDYLKWKDVIPIFDKNNSTKLSLQN